MPANEIYLYWHARENVWFDPFRGLYRLPRFPQRLRRLDNYVVRVQAVNTYEFTPGADRTAPSSAVHSLANFTGAITALKTDVDAADFAVAYSGFLTSDTGWHNANTGAKSFPLLADSNVTLGQQYFSIQLTPGPSTLARVLPLTLEQEFVSGSESNIPVGYKESFATGTIPAGADRVDITVTGMTETGEAAPYWRGIPYSTLGVICGTNKVTVVAGGPMEVNAPVGVAIYERE